ncbi:hypothetical protein B0T25DRAFT_202291 [Lasiosphaeria hispida]|uniref:Uncharacterized protein n=1 Tax=Lasiosphaeria hispida TaxID=260671 RepID=A0AAJ0HIR3_9PEZI|nr:hypothetical protein B0T25DRAFT_202291 [Lasiosphaeria hispida]
MCQPDQYPRALTPDSSLINLPDALRALGSGVSAVSSALFWCTALPLVTITDLNQKTGRYEHRTYRPSGPVRCLATSSVAIGLLVPTITIFFYYTERQARAISAFGITTTAVIGNSKSIRLG